MYGNNRVLKEQLWSQETGSFDHRNGNASLRLFGSFSPFQTDETVLSSDSYKGESNQRAAILGIMGQQHDATKLLSRGVSPTKGQPYACLSYLQANNAT